MFVLRFALATAIFLAAAPAQAQDGAAAPGSGTETARASESAARAKADEADDEADVEAADESEADTISPGALPILAALVPGILIHGTGHYVGGDKKTALRLLKWQAIGLSLAAASGLYLRLSGGSRYGTEIAIPMLFSGAGLMINTFVADLYGSASGGNDHQAAVRAKQSATLGYAYIHDPQFSYRHFSRATARIELGPLYVEPLLWTALDDDNQRARMPVSYRILSSPKGEFFELTTAFTAHHFGTEDFSTYVGEVRMGLRIEMARLGPSLRGSFASASGGIGVQETRFNVPGVGGDTHAILLGHFGYGFYLPKSGELEGYYEHRRDNFTAGSSPGPRNGSGFLGHFGLKLRQPINQRFAIQAQAEIGSAYLVTTGLEVQWGDKP